METWNQLNFPFKIDISELNGECILTLYKYLLDNLEGDINLEDAPIKKYFSIISDSKEECTKLFNIINKERRLV